MSHLGRPKGQVVDGLRMAPVAARLSELLGRPVATADDCVGPAAAQAAAALRPGRRPAAREPALPRGGDRQRRRVRPPAGGARRRLRERRLRHGAPRARLHRGRHALPAVGGRPAHDQGARGPRPPAARPGAAVRGGPRRPQGLGQDQPHPAHAHASPTRCSSAAPWPTRSSPPRATRSARPRAPATRWRSPPRSSPRPATARGRARHPDGRRRGARGRRRRALARRAAPTASPPTRWRSTSARRPSAEFVHQLRGAGTIYWNGPMGLFEIGGVRGRHARRRRGHRRRRRRDGRRRRRHRVGRPHRSAWRAASPTCPPAAAPPWNSWRAGPCPAWRRSWIRTTAATTAGRRPLMAGNWKMYKTPRARRRRSSTAFVPLVAGVDDRDVLLCPPDRLPGDGARRAPPAAPWRSAPRPCTTPPRAPSPARSRRGMLVELGVPVRDPRALRAPAVLQRERRRPGAQGPGGARRRPAARSSAAARRSRSARAARPRARSAASSTPTSPRSAPPSWPPWPSPTSPSGPSAPASRRRPSRRRRRWRSAAARCASASATPPTACASCTAAASSPTTSTRSWRSRTSTACSSAARASTRRGSAASCSVRGARVTRSGTPAGRRIAPSS